MTTLTINTQRLLEAFLAMVRINSPSGEEDEMRTWLVGQMNSLKLSHHTDKGGNLIVDVPAHQCQHNAILVLSGHMDVVPPCLNIKPIVEEADGDKIISSDNTTVLGADDKAGLAPILEAVQVVLEQGLPRPALRLIFTTREETKLGGAQDLEDADLKANFALIFDHTGKQGVIINEAPTYIEFVAECFGKSVHAGIMPEAGVNAIQYASRVINRLHLGRIDEDTTANIGFFDGGKATNVVPDLATIRGEIRSHNQATLDCELAHIETVLKEEKEKLPGTDFTFKTAVAFEHYKVDESLPAVKLVWQSAEKAGLTPQFIRTNGGSDNNIFAKRGLPGEVLSAGFIEPHSLKERVKLSEMETCTRFILTMLEEFSKNEF